MSEHTPGPWIPMRHYPDGHLVGIDSSAGPVVRLDGIADAGSGRGEANGRLMLAAPDLIEVARLLVEWDSDFVATQSWDKQSAVLADAIHRARAALAKAEGREPTDA